MAPRLLHSNTKNEGFGYCYDYVAEPEFDRKPRTLELGLSPLAFPQCSQCTTPGLGSYVMGTLPLIGRALDSGLPFGKWGSGQGSTLHTPPH